MNSRAIRYLIAILVMIILSGCSGSNQAITSSGAIADPGAESYVLKPYLIRPGDVLDIKFFYNPELNETVTVRPDGMISLQLIDDVKAIGLQPKELDQSLTDLYKKDLRKPSITVIVRTFSGQRIYVGGEVGTEGLIEMNPGMTVLQAVFQAGGLLDTAQPAETIVIRKGEGNRPVPIKIDLMSQFKGESNSRMFYLNPDDVVFVPKSQIAQANVFVNQYIERLLLFRGVSLGFSYELKSDQNN